MMNELTYTQNGDYFIPDLKLEHPETKPLGKYGRMRRAFLQENNPMLLNDLILTEQLFPHLQEIDETAYKPYREGLITEEVALERAQLPIKEFMSRQLYTNDVNLFLTISNERTGNEVPTPATHEELLDLGMEIIIPAFITSELKRAFTIGFLLFIPFLIIDMVVSSTLMSMGMVMLPPSMISLPFKIMIFVLVDGWGLLISSLVRGFR